MREDLARWIALLSAVVAVAMAIAFALRQNPPDALRGGVEAKAVSPPQLRELRADAGRAVYEAQNCSMCHSVSGVGNPRYPLDRVGARMDRAEIQRWIVGDPAVADRLPSGIRRAKQSYAELDGDEMEALIDYLQSLGH